MITIVEIKLLKENILSMCLCVYVFMCFTCFQSSISKRHKQMYQIEKPFWVLQILNKYVNIFVTRHIKYPLDFIVLYLCSLLLSLSVLEPTNYNKYDTPLKDEMSENMLFES